MAELERRGSQDYYVIRHLERLPLGTPYPAVAQRLVAICEGVRARVARAEAERMLEPPCCRPPAEDASLTVFVDATGVGQPVVDLLAQSDQAIACTTGP